jgi:hypothetical protein
LVDIFVYKGVFPFSSRLFCAGVLAVDPMRRPMRILNEIFFLHRFLTLQPKGCGSMIDARSVAGAFLL